MIAYHDFGLELHLLVLGLCTLSRNGFIILQYLARAGFCGRFIRESVNLFIQEYNHLR